MTLPEHAICSFMLAQLSSRVPLDREDSSPKGGSAHRRDWVVLVTIAGISPDLDVVAKLFGDQYFWQLHHALGHSLLSITVLSLFVTGVGGMLTRVKPSQTLFRWCWLAAFVHCLTDTFYWWGVKPLWPIAEQEVTLDILEYIDLFVLSIWLAGAWQVYRRPADARRIAVRTLVLFFAYAGARAVLPKPTGAMSLLTGNWMYAIEQGTPVVDWW